MIVALAFTAACNTLPEQSKPDAKSVAPVETYLAFFEPLSTKLLPDTRETIASAAASAKSNVRVTIQIVSNSDAMRSSLEFAKKAATRRVEIVKRELVAHGFSDDRIAISIVDREPPRPPKPGHILIYCARFY